MFLAELIQSDSMVNIDDIIKAYVVARSNKKRSADAVEYELNYEYNLMRLCDNINNRTLRPTAYTFVTMKPKPREIFACEMGMRVIHHYLDIRLRPLIENKLTKRTFNNRKGYGQNAAINQLITDIYEVSKGYTRDAWIIKVDLKGYFPNANQQIVYDQLSNLIIKEYSGDDKDDLLYMLQRAVFSFPQNHCYRKSPIWKWQYIEQGKSLFDKPEGIGAAIGHLLWQNAMNYYLNDFDHYIVDTLGIRYVRFVDDMVFVVDNKIAFLPIMENIRSMLKNQFNCELHPKKFYCQHWSKGVEFIGSYIKCDRVCPSKRTKRRAFRQIHNLNRCVRINRINAFISSVNSYLGIFKTRNAYAVICELINKIDNKWWKYVTFDDRNKTIVANDNYKFNKLLKQKYDYDKRNNRKAHKRARINHYCKQ